MDQETLFDKNTARIGVRLPGSDRVLEFAFPSDEQWEAHERRLSGPMQRNPRATSRLLTELSGGENPGLNKHEEWWCWGRLTKFIGRCTITGETANVDAKVAGGFEVAFTLKAPQLKDVNEYMSDMFIGTGEDRTPNVELQKELAHRLIRSHDGYQGDPPLAHRIAAVITALDALLTISQEPDRDFLIRTPQAQASAASPSDSSAAGAKASSEAQT